MGVLTKPDLAMETTTKDAVIELLNGRRNVLKLGYYVVKNRSADDNSSTLPDRTTAEEAFFRAPPWSSFRDRCGVAVLKARLQQLLLYVMRQEFPHVKMDIEKHLTQCKSDIVAMGPSRQGHAAQRQYLGKIASKFQSTTQNALNGYYTVEKSFQSEPSLRLITRIIKLNENFADVFWKKGHLHSFESESDAMEEKAFEKGTENAAFEISLTKYPELYDIIGNKDYKCESPTKRPLISRIKQVYETSRGPEIGTVSTSSTGETYGSAHN